jgi:nucleoside phosphorylase
VFERHGPSFHECKVAARAVLRTARGKTVLNTVRPRGISGVLRGRPSLTVQFFLAGRAGWLWWATPDRFALLQPPSEYRPANRAARWLWMLNRYWDLVVWLVPLACVMLFAVALALVPTVPTRFVALLLLGGVMLVAVVMVSLVTLGGLWRLFTIVEPARWKRDSGAIDAYLDEHWSVSLCHVRDAAAVDEVLRALHDWDDTVFVLESGVTEPDTLTAIRHAAPPLGENSGVLVVQRSAQRKLPIPDPRPLGGVTLLAAIAVVLPFVMAGTVAGWERDACGRQDCTDRPATYGRALYWLFYQYRWSDPPGLSPLSIQARLFGPELRVLILVVILTLFVTTVRYRRWLKKEIQNVSATTMTHRTVTLVLVASTVERDAVIESVRQANGNSTPTRTFSRHHTVFDLGVVTGSRVLLAQSEQGVESPGAMMLTANDLIVECSPDYVVLVGVCFGLREGEQRIGDVLVPTQLRNMNWRKVVQAVDGASAEFVQGDRVSPGVLLDRCRAATVDWPGARVHFGILLSENALVDSPEYARHLREREPDALGAEMEGAGVYAAAARSKVDWIIIKGIAGWGQHTAEEFQVAGARSAADFLTHIFRIGALGQLDREPTSEPSQGLGPRVFISYAHDSAEHKAQVRRFAGFLTANGIDARLDLWDDVGRLDWSAWMIEQWREADFVLVVASPEYLRRAEGTGVASVGRGVQFETAILRDEQIRDRASMLGKVLPVVLPGRSVSELPLFLQPYSATRYVVTAFTREGAEDLLRALTRQPAYVRPPLGRLPVLPPHD